MAKVLRLHATRHFFKQLLERNWHVLDTRILNYGDVVLSAVVVAVAMVFACTAADQVAHSMVGSVPGL